jgi:hypothetical protein
MEFVSFLSRKDSLLNAILKGRINSHSSLLLFLILSTTLIHSCGLDIEDPSPPSAPVWFQKSAPNEWPERGIDAHESGGIFLEWVPNPEDNIKAYVIYRAERFNENDSLGEYESINHFEIVSNTPLEFIDTEIKMDTKYFYKLKADNSSGNRSAFSDSLYYSLLPQISPNLMVPNGKLEALSPIRSLIWHYSYLLEMEDYCLTILTQSNDLVIRAVLSPVDYVNGSESWQIPDSIYLDLNQIYKWRIDTNGDYFNNLETAGSESHWASFLYSSH